MMYPLLNVRDAKTTPVIFRILSGPQEVFVYTVPNKKSFVDLYVDVNGSWLWNEYRKNPSKGLIDLLKRKFASPFDAEGQQWKPRRPVKKFAYCVFDRTLVRRHPEHDTWIYPAWQETSKDEKLTDLAPHEGVAIVLLNKNQHEAVQSALKSGRIKAKKWNVPEPKDFDTEFVVEYDKNGGKQQKGEYKIVELEEDDATELPDIDFSSLQLYDLEASFLPYPNELLERFIVQDEPLWDLLKEYNRTWFPRLQGQQNYTSIPIPDAPAKSSAKNVPQTVTLEEEDDEDLF